MPRFPDTSRHRRGACFWGLLVVAWLLGSGAVLAEAENGAARRRPNILLILVDDLGKEWIGCYGAGDIATPHIDSLAQTGMKFENAYCMPQCTPTRVTLLTGQYPFRHGWTNHWDVPRWGSGAHFDPELNPSFARVMRSAGYATAVAGKWQIDDFRVEPDALAEAGFDEWCVWTGGEGGNPPSDQRYWDPYIHMGNQSRTYPGKFGPDVYNEFLMDFMRRHSDRPMLLYYPMCLTHTPLVATPDAPEAEGRLERHKAMVRYTDKLVGRLVDQLEQLGLRDETIIVFTTDNGTSGRITGERLGRQVRGAKAKMNEAGTAVPFIVSCPGRTPQGVTTGALTDFTDVLPTFAELAGTELSSRWVADGHSIAPVVLGESNESPRRWILSLGGNPAKFRDGRVVPAQEYDDRVIRDERWKLWVDENRRPQKLIDLQNDPWEEHNLLHGQNPQTLAAEARDAVERLMTAIEQMPPVDAAPRYRPNPPQPWDKEEY